jgi:predicted methyltransferase
MRAGFAPMVLAALCCVSAGCAVQQRPASKAQDPATAAAIDRILASPHRSAESRARDAALHPKETLAFFGIRPQMSVVEVWPGGGWYTDILAPLLHDQGELRVALVDATAGDYARTVTENFRAKLAAQPDVFGKVQLTTLAAPPAKGVIAPENSADVVVTFFNLHTWMMFGWQREAVAAMYTALKPGGVLGVVEHRGNPKIPQDAKAASGYVNESYAIDLIRSVGFELVAQSPVNSNPRDTKDYEKGVWALPPDFADGADDHARYAAIGESDRFTLKFRKPTK